MSASEFDAWHMTRALELARRGQGLVEPNPLVGCTIVAGDQVVGEGWHQRFGDAHAEVEALASAGPRAAGATLYVTLEPCCHHGKTPPCSEAILRAGVRRVVAALADPFPAVDGRGIAALRAAGVDVSVGLLADEARRLNAPYLKLVESGMPWIIGKWAMTLDGKIATRTGASRWISSAASRAIVHQLRGRVDAVMVGARTALVDDPLLIAEPAGPRMATRVVVDTRAAIGGEGRPDRNRLLDSARQAPVLVAVGEQALRPDVERLRAAGCEVFVCAGDEPPRRLENLLVELGRRRMTNVLVEGGGQLLGSLHDAGQLDEIHAFVAPRLFGGNDAPSPMAGLGISLPGEALALEQVALTTTGGDIYIRGRVARGVKKTV
jgi:diaminohydroxyphosphoribosylaminopyrimidine deaminase / 5-amino-6-(5-phosphoribosylamino)uracil reductase